MCDSRHHQIYISDFQLSFPDSREEQLETHHDLRKEYRHRVEECEGKHELKYCPNPRPDQIISTLIFLCLANSLAFKTFGSLKEAFSMLSSMITFPTPTFVPSAITIHFGFT